MSQLTLYRQKRRDGGIRSGIESDGDSLLASYFEGPAELEDDPRGAILEWYVDVRCQGEELPTEAEQAREWFVRLVPIIQDGARRFADEVSVGTDDSFPLRWADFANAPKDVGIEIVCSVIHRIAGHEFGNILREFADQLPELLRELRAPSPSLR